MYATIIIYGEKNDNLAIMNKLIAYDHKMVDINYTFNLYYKNASVAQQDLNQAYKQLKADSPKSIFIQIYRSDGNKPIRLQYNGSRAFIARTNQN